ncbi:MAG: tetratricopeptide repeat protein [Candidatus Zixiibacteriota bacterium]
MKVKLALLWAAAFVLLSPPLSFSEKYLDYESPRIQAVVLEGIHSSFREDYALAESSFQTLIRMAPEDPAGYFFLAALYQARMIDYESNFREKELYENVKTAKRFARERIKKNGNDAWAYVILGNSYGVKAVYNAKKGKWWSGLNEGLSAKSALNKAVKLDPELYDAYVGLGSYHYWASVKTRALWWLPFIGDHRQKGITQTKLALEKSIFSSTAAASGLIWMYIVERQYDLAIDLARKMQFEYPQGKSFLWPLAQAYFEKGDWQNALITYRELLERLERDHGSGNPNQSYNLIECRFYIASSLFSLGRYAECESVCEEILSLPLDEKMQERQENKLKRSVGLSEKCVELSGRKE